MIAGTTWTGCDGTVYQVVRPEEVLRDQYRWWIDRDMLEDYDRAHRGWVDNYLVGPESPVDLHLIPCEDTSEDGTIVFALVEPSL